MLVDDKTVSLLSLLFFTLAANAFGLILTPKGKISLLCHPFLKEVSITYQEARAIVNDLTFLLKY